jgi:cardiolipin synthase
VNIELLVDSTEFWDRLADDIAAARHRAWVQTLSFEGDAAGRLLADAMLACRATDRRILVDDYTRFWLSDRFIYGARALRDPVLRAEVRATRTMMRDLEAGGVGVRFVSPLGFLFRRLAARNHKKIMLIDDDVAWIGGINFSDHNFEWHDLMLRFEDPDIAGFLQTDVRATWTGHAAPARARFDGLELLSLDGADNESRLQSVLRRLAGAERSIVVHNAYITFPFTDALRAAAARGVRITVITPAVNNRGFMREYMVWEGRRSGFEIRLYPGRMSHLKAIVIDDRTLITGSSNFDWLTYTYQPEIIAVIERPETIETFRARVLEPDLAISPPAEGPCDERRARLAWRVIRALSRIGRVICPPVRRPWPDDDGIAEPESDLAVGGGRN